MSLRCMGMSAILVALLAGCNGGTPTPPRPTASPTAAAAPSPTATLPEALTATTNEPFYAAVVDGEAIRLSGVDLPERRLPITARTAVSGGLRWQADGVEVTVTDRPCEDDMSGQARPFTATLRIAGRVARGCAFPTPVRPTPSAAADEIPARFVGRWDRDAAACAASATSIEGVTIAPRALRIHESVGQVTAVDPAGEGVRIAARYSGEGEEWTTRQTLRVDGDRLTITGEGTPINRVRC